MLALFNYVDKEARCRLAIGHRLIHRSERHKRARGQMRRPPADGAGLLRTGGTYMLEARHIRLWSSLRPHLVGWPSRLKQMRTSRSRLPDPPHATAIMSGLRFGLASTNALTSASGETVKSSFGCTKRCGIFTEL